MDFLSNFGDFITEQLIRSDISVFELSKRSGINNSVIKRWQTAEFMPSLDSLIRIADYFNVPIDFMIGLSDYPTLVRLDPPCTFAHQLQLLMQQRNLTSYRLAKDCNVGRAAVSKWLLEQRVPNFESIVIVAQYLNCSVDFLIGRGR